MTLPSDPTNDFPTRRFPFPILCGEDDPFNSATLDATDILSSEKRVRGMERKMITNIDLCIMR
jgi:hypothetical protein